METLEVKTTEHKYSIRNFREFKFLKEDLRIKSKPYCTFFLAEEIGFGDTLVESIHGFKDFLVF